MVPCCGEACEGGHVGNVEFAAEGEALEGCFEVEDVELVGSCNVGIEGGGLDAVLVHVGFGRPAVYRVVVEGG